MLKRTTCVAKWCKSHRCHKKGENQTCYISKKAEGMIEVKRIGAAANGRC